MKIDQRKSVFAGLLLCCWFLMGCEKEVIIPELEGNIVGYLYTYNQFGEKLSDHSDVLISTQGLDGSYTARTDASGRYEFKNIPAGTYDLEFSKSGYGTIWLKGVRHLGGRPTILAYNNEQNIYVWSHMFEFPTTTINNIYLDSDTLIAEFNFSNLNDNSVGVMVYFSDQNDFQKNAAIIKCYYFFQNNGIYKSALFKNELPFAPGQTLYIRAAVLSSFPVSCARIDNDNNYVSCFSGEIFYPTLGDESEEYSIIFPE